MTARFYFDGLDQKTLYFKINSCLNLESENEKRIAGVYAIFKDDICLYVGQSKNLASRATSHILGKYSNCDYIKLIDITDVGFVNFWDRSEPSRQSVLNNAEITLMQILKPIENVITDYTKKIPDNHKPDFFESASFVIDCRDAQYGNITITSDTSDIIIDSSFFHRAYENENVFDLVVSYQIDNIVIKEN